MKSLLGDRAVPWEFPRVAGVPPAGGRVDGTNPTGPPSSDEDRDGPTVCVRSESLAAPDGSLVYGFKCVGLR